MIYSIYRRRSFLRWNVSLVLLLIHPTMTTAVDLSSFPLLRIDQLHLHETQTLLQAEAQLETLQHENGMDSIASFISKLLLSIRKEIADRKANVSNNTASSPPLQKLKPTPTKKPSGRKVPSWISNRSNSALANTTSNTVVSFVSSPKSSSNFRSRVKAALIARSQTATTEQSEQQRAERTRQTFDTMQAWRSQREQSKAQRDALFEEEERLRRQRRKERSEREKQVRDSMHAAAEEAKSKALESGCTEEEAVVKAAAAASQAANVVNNDGDSSLFNSSSVDADDESFVDDASEGERVLPKTLFDDVSSSEDSPDTELASSKDEHDERPPTPTTGKSVDGLEYAHDNDVYCCSERSKDSTSKSDTLSTPIETSLSRDEQQNISSLLIDTNENELHHDRDVCPPLADIVVTTEVAQPPTEIEQHTIAKDESDGSQLSLYFDKVQVSDDTATSPARATEELCNDGSSLRNDEDTFLTSRKKGRELCDLFPSFPSIFTKFVRKGKSHINDSTQKELISCMQHQIKLHELHPRHSLQSDDDYSVESNIESCRFYSINSRRPEVRALLDEVFSHHALSEWNELSDDVNASSWNLLWTWGLPKASEFDNLLVFQKINRFRHTKGLTRKDLLQKNLQRFASGHLMPLTYALPHEYNSFVAAYSSFQKLAESNPNLWIVKPIGLSRG